MPYHENHLPLNTIFQQDNAPPHRCQAQQQNIYYALATSIAGPENHRKRVALYQKASEMKKELINNVNEIWQSIPISFTRNLIHSMLRTIEAVDKGLSY